MIALVQRVSQARVIVKEPAYEASVGRGFLVLLGVEKEDKPSQAQWLAAKVGGLRIFSGRDGKMSLSLGDVEGEVLALSQFTLAGDLSQGRRPSFDRAAPPSEAEPLYELFCQELAKSGPKAVRKGVFGALMEVSLVNDGPVSLILRR